MYLPIIQYNEAEVFLDSLNDKMIYPEIDGPWRPVS